MGDTVTIYPLLTVIFLDTDKKPFLDQKVA